MGAAVAIAAHGIPEQEQVEQHQRPEEQRWDQRIPQQLAADGGEQSPAEAPDAGPDEEVDGPARARCLSQRRELLLLGDPLLHRGRCTPRGPFSQSELLQRERHAAVAAAHFPGNPREASRTGDGPLHTRAPLLLGRRLREPRLPPSTRVADGAGRRRAAPWTGRRIARDGRAPPTRPLSAPARPPPAPPPPPPLCAPPRLPPGRPPGPPRPPPPGT